MPTESHTATQILPLEGSGVCQASEFGLSFDLGVDRHGDEMTPLNPIEDNLKRSIAALADCRALPNAFLNTDDTEFLMGDGYGDSDEGEGYGDGYGSGYGED